MKLRILLGLVMILVVGCLLVLDWWIEQTVRPLQETESPQQAPRPWRQLIGLPVAAMLLVLTSLAFVEFGRLAAFNGVLILVVSGLLGAVTLGMLPFWWQLLEPIEGLSGTDVLLVVALFMAAAFLEQMIRYRTSDAMRRIACTFLAVLYLGVGAALVLAMRLTYGVGILVLFLATVKSADIGAYFGGSAIGRHKLIVWLSPGKSWEGLLIGLAVAAAVSMVCVRALRIQSISLWQAAVFGLVVALAGQFADLCESLLKRSANMKDSGSLVPGFGGVLDIVDSPLLASPIAMLLLRAMV